MTVPTRIFVVGSCPLRRIGLRYGGTLIASASGELRALRGAGWEVRPAADLLGDCPMPEAVERLAALPDALRALLGSAAIPATATGAALQAARQAGVRPGRYPLGDVARGWLARWAAMGQSVVQQGPQVLCRASAVDVREYDLRAAYLRGLRCKMGVGKETKIAAGEAWDGLRDEVGIVEADVAVRTDRQIPPLCVRRQGVTLWPLGAFRWVGPISTLRAAVEAGEAEVGHVYGGVFWRSRSYPLAALADTLDALEPKWLRKLLYTRIYGALASDGVRASMDASTPLDTEPVWEVTRPDPTVPRVWRPDWAAEVAGLCLREVQASMRLLRPGCQVVSAHVDALWVSGPQDDAAFPPALYKIKGEGDYRGFAVGWFDHAGRVARAGVPEGADPQLVRKRVASATWRSRLWAGKPWETEEATSAPPWLDELETGVAPPARSAV